MPRRRIKRKSSALALAVAVGFAAPSISPAANTFYIAPGGMDTNNGSIGAPFATFSKAISSSAAGDTILVRGGTYGISSTVSISTSKNGTAANPFTMAAYPGETPVLDFHTQTIGSSARGISLAANYWRISGLTVQNAGDNGMIISGSNNIVQQCVARQNQDSGFFIQGTTTTTPRNAAGNLLLNCDSYGNYDIAANGENADGFAVKFRGLGPNNVLSGCRSFNNADDGADFWQAENGVTVQNCWMFHNGISASFVGVPGTYNGDGNGIKLGHDSSTHLLKNNLVWGNPANGIDVNGNATQLEADSNPAVITHGVTILDNTAYANGGKNFQFDENPQTATPPTNHILRNNISLAGGGANVVAGNTQDHNSWNAGFSVSNGDFVSVTDPVTANGVYHPITDRQGTTTPTFGTGAAMGARQADGSLPDLGGFLRLQSASALIGAGVNVGLPYITAPDLGAYEFVPAGTAYWGLSSGGAEEPTWNWIAGVAPDATRVANYDLGNATTYTVNFASSPTHAGLMVRSGAVTLNLAGNTYTLTGAIGGSGTLTISGGGTVKISPNGGAVGTSKISALNITGSAKLDLSDNHLITATAVGSWTGSNYTGVTGLVATGRGSSGTWTGAGIVTSQSTATTSNLTSLGVATAADIGITATALWAGQTVSSSDTLVMYTYGGDANLDGKINIDDYVRIDNGLANNLTGWANGDFNYDGKVNIDDYTTIIDQNIGNQNGVFFTSGGIGDGGAFGVTAIPEPFAAGLLIVPAILLASRRARRAPRAASPNAHG